MAISRMFGTTQACSRTILEGCPIFSGCKQPYSSLVSTMVQTRRNSKNSNGRASIRAKRSTESSLPNSPKKQNVGTPSPNKDLKEVIADIFVHSRREIWWKILPDTDGNGDIVAATGIPWKIVLPLLISLRIVTAKVTSVVKTYAVSHTKLLELAASICHRCTMEISKMQDITKGNSKYYFCVGKPQFATPLKQRLAVESAAKRSLLKSLMLPVPSLGVSDKIQKRARTVAKVVWEKAVRQRLEKLNRAGAVGQNFLQQPQCIFCNEALESCCCNGNNKEICEDAPNGNVGASLADQLQQQVQYALALDLMRTPRLSRSGGVIIERHDRKNANQMEKSIVLHLANRWGWQDKTLTWEHRQEIGRAACRQVAYDHGFKQDLGVSRLAAWYGELNMALDLGESTDPLSPSNSGSQSYCDVIEENFPGYLHQLFRHAQHVRGAMATFHELADIMNQKSAMPGEDRPTLSLSRKQVARWFKKYSGKERASCEKPLLTTEHKQRRVAWARQNFNLFCDAKAPVCFLDEKWFYTTNRRRTMKILPRGVNEHEVPTTLHLPKIRSRRFAIKVMFLGVVACPHQEREFDGRVFLERISKPKTVTRTSRNKNFSVDVLVNDAIKAGEWLEFYVDGMDVSELLGVIVDTYDLDGLVAERLELSYLTHTRGGNPKRVILESDDDILEGRTIHDAQGAQHPLQLADLDLYVKLEPGDIIDEDISCDSSYMLGVTPRVADAIRNSFHWVPPADPVYLVMDNAGGHGTSEAIAQYVAMFEARNIRVIWQVPRSPETNMLDLGIWMSIQSQVVKAHHMRRCNKDALSKSVYDAWNNYLSIRAFKNVHGRLRVVLAAIVEGNGSNDLVEAKRGKLFREATIIDDNEGAPEDEAIVEEDDGVSVINEDISDNETRGWI